MFKRLERKNLIRKRKGSFLVIEFLGLIPIFFLLMAIMFDVSQLYTAVINQTLATQAAASEIAFMGEDGKEDQVIPNAVRKANAIIAFALDKDPDGNSHQSYKYELLEFAKNNPGLSGPGRAYVLPHNLQRDDRFLEDGGTDRYKDHRKEIWGFRITGTYSFENTQLFNNPITIEIVTTQYMGILKGIRN